MLLCFHAIGGVAVYAIGGWSSVLRYVVQLMGSVAAGATWSVVIASFAFERDNNRPPLWVRSVRAIGAIYVGIFLIAVTRGSSLIRRPPITVVPAGGTEVRGRLLNHVDDQWNIITDTGDILAIPDSKSGVTTVPKRPGTPTTGTPTPCPGP